MFTVLQDHQCSARVINGAVMLSAGEGASSNTQYAFYVRQKKKLVKVPYSFSNEVIFNDEVVDGFFSVTFFYYKNKIKKTIKKIL